MSTYLNVNGDTNLSIENPNFMNNAYSTVGMENKPLQLSHNSNTTLTMNNNHPLTKSRINNNNETIYLAPQIGIGGST